VYFPRALADYEWGDESGIEVRVENYELRDVDVLRTEIYNPRL
jgi:hypothetical protein